MTTKRHREAVRDLTDAQKISSGEEGKEALRERAACHLDLKDYQAAIEDCSAALQIDGQDAAALLTRGKCHLARKEHALTAIDFYEAARLGEALRGDAVRAIEGCEKHLTATDLAEVAEQPGARLTGGQRQGLGKIIEIYKLKEEVAEIEKTKKRPASLLLVALLVLGLASLASCFGLFAAPIRYEWYGPFLFLNLAWVLFAVWAGVSFGEQQRLDSTVNAPQVEEIERRSLAIRGHEASFGLDRAPKKEANPAPALVVLGLILLLVSAVWLWGIIKPQERVRAEIAVADEQWEAGKEREAVAGYRRVIENDLMRVARDNRPRLFQRVIEADVADGDIETARRFVTMALDGDVALSLTDPNANALLAQARSSRSGGGGGPSEADPGKNKDAAGRSSRREKLAAFDKVVVCWKAYLGSAGDDESKKKWVADTGQAQVAFAKIPFDPKADREACRTMLDRYKSELGFLKELSQVWYAQNDISTADERHLLRELTKQLELIFKVGAGTE